MEQNIEPFIDVIVPVYNVKQYVKRCVDSVLAQSYEKYRIILVDDGSTDGSSKICDWYAEKYENILVLHKDNGGLSSARNAGVDVSNAEFITFIDSDDYIAPCYLENLLNGVVSNSADMSIVRLISVNDDTDITNIQKSKDIKKSALVLNKEEAIRHMCYRKYFGFSSCGKLFRREHLVKHPFPVGMLHEDMATTYKLIGECKTIAYIDSADYFYVQHGGEGITRSIFDEKHMDAVNAAQGLYKYINEYCPNIEPAGLAALAYSYLLVTKTMTGNSAYDRRSYNRIHDKLRSLVFSKGVVFDKNLSFKTRIQFLLVSLGYGSMVLNWKLYYRLLRIRKQ